MLPRAWWRLADWLTSLAGRLGCRLLDRHHYAACRGRRDHGSVADRFGYPARRR